MTTQEQDYIEKNAQQGEYRFIGLSTKNQAAEYVKKVGKSESKKSVHYATGKICGCKSCFCCHVFSIVNQPDKGPFAPVNLQRTEAGEETLRQAVKLASQSHAQARADLFFDHCAHGSED